MPQLFSNEVFAVLVESYFNNQPNKDCYKNKKRKITSTSILKETHQGCGIVYKQNIAAKLTVEYN